MEFPFHFGHKEAPKPAEQPEAAKEQLTEEGISQEAVAKSEAFADPLSSVKEVGSVVIKAEQVGDSNVVELPTPETPREPVDTDHQIPAQTA